MGDCHQYGLVCAYLQVYNIPYVTSLSAPPCMLQDAAAGCLYTKLPLVVNAELVSFGTNFMLGTSALHQNCQS